MRSNLFKIVTEAIKNAPINSWKIKEYSNCTKFYAEQNGIIVGADGGLKVDGIWQKIGFFQKRKLRNIFFSIQEELATRSVQKKFDIA